jgi:hypothetical protein
MSHARGLGETLLKTVGLGGKVVEGLSQGAGVSESFQCPPHLIEPPTRMVSRPSRPYRPTHLFYPTFLTFKTRYIYYIIFIKVSSESFLFLFFLF